MFLTKIIIEYHYRILLQPAPSEAIWWFDNGDGNYNIFGILVKFTLREFLLEIFGIINSDNKRKFAQYTEALKIYEFMPFV